MSPNCFVKPRSVIGVPKEKKPMKPMSRPDGFTNTEWVQECRRRKIETECRKDRMATSEMRGAREASEHAAARTTMSRPMPIAVLQYAAHWGSQPSVGSPTGFSPISPALFQESQANPQSRFSSSPEFDGGFNPNVLLPCPAPRSPAFNIDINVPCASSPAYLSSSAMRWGPLPFSGSSSSPNNFGEQDARKVFARMVGNTYMSDMIASGSASAASGFFTEEQSRIAAEHGLESQDFGEEDSVDQTQAEAKDDVDQTLAKEGSLAAAKGKLKNKASTTEPRVKWMTLEDLCLVEA